MTWIDISQPLSNDTVGWPGDTPYSFSLKWTKEETGSVNVGKLEMSTHLGTHIDAPFHFDSEGKKVIDLDPNRYIGKAKIIEVTNQEVISLKYIEKYHFNGSTIVLLKTMAWVDRSSFPRKVPVLEKGVVSYLAENGIKLLGIDLPSVDHLDSKELSIHHELTKHDIHILEGIVLDTVKEGMCDLIALPLPLVDGDGSPVRAVIRY
ncbi:arylformamidase [Bacillus suaedaesalsae]|uniref:Arylformamidase n=1 Tax=Bacillus suaedaesalsae TaxID=2810349 RepID=A0ABS2DGQ9_9BACI|nr:arylformamidase [Bacillus suaedaesalsae]MBM6617659.1 arylformamidase [Bacillus suaedaesalsae]